MSSFLNRRKVTLGAVALAVTLGAGVGLSGQAQAAGLANYPNTVACYKNHGSKNPNRMLFTDPTRIGNTVRYTVIPQFWLLGRYQHLKSNGTSFHSVNYQDAHFDTAWVCNSYSNNTGQYWPYAELIKWGV